MGWDEVIATQCRSLAEIGKTNIRYRRAVCYIWSTILKVICYISAIGFSAWLHVHFRDIVQQL